MEEDELTLSDVHVGRETVATDKTGVVMTRFMLKNPPEKEPNNSECADDGPDSVDIDEDGDLILDRLNSSSECDVIYIYHAMSTKLKDVGLQVWSGCLLLCDFIIDYPEIFQDKNIIELGAGTGLASIVAARNASCIFCTDTGEAILQLCQQNMESNDASFGSTEKVTVKELNWMNKLSVGSNKFQWSSLELDALRQVDVILAADVIYSDPSTQAFFETIKWLCQMKGRCEVYISLEKRLNFTLTDLEVQCPAYNFFLEILHDFASEDENNDIVYKVKQEATDFRQHFEYNRTQYLELWYISAERKRATKEETMVG